MSDTTIPSNGGTTNAALQTDNLQRQGGITDQGVDGPNPLTMRRDGISAVTSGPLSPADMDFIGISTDNAFGGSSIRTNQGLKDSLVTYAKSIQHASAKDVTALETATKEAIHSGIDAIPSSIISDDVKAAKKATADQLIDRITAHFASARNTANANDQLFTEADVDHLLPFADGVGRATIKDSLNTLANALEFSDSASEDRLVAETIHDGDAAIASSDAIPPDKKGETQNNFNALVNRIRTQVDADK